MFSGNKTKAIKVKLLKNYINRSASVITGKRNLEILYTFQKFPVFMGCSDQDYQDDLFADMEWAIDPDTGIVQLTNLVPLDILYMNQHMDAIGATWQQYNQELAAFVAKFRRGITIEIGGGSGKLANEILKIEKNLKYTVVEPNPTFKDTEQIKIVKTFFTKEIGKQLSPDTIVLSHVLEHVYDPYEFLCNLNESLPKQGRFVFGYPNLEYLFKNRFTNAINFEHTILMTDYYVDYFVKIAGFKIVKKIDFKDHSHFYCVEKTCGFAEARSISIDSRYLHYKQMFIDFIDHHHTLVKEINQKIANHSGEVFLFGAHIFSQYLIAFGLNSARVAGILDNSPPKQGKRLYGSKLKVRSPSDLKNIKNPMVILKAGLYNDEIKNQIVTTINPNVVFV